MKKITLILTFVWSGLLLGAPLEFQTPNITTKLELGIGKLIFFALNKVELIIAIIIIIGLYKIKPSKIIQYIFSIIIGILLLQLLYFLPALNQRAEAIIVGEFLPPSYHHHHIAYIILEALKGVLLLFGGIKSYNYKSIR